MRKTMNKTLPLVAAAALAFTVLSTETAQAQQFGNEGWSGNGNQQVQPATRGPILQWVVDFATVLENVQRRGLNLLPNRDSALDSSTLAINEYGPLGDNRPTLLTAPSFQRKYVRNLQGMQTA
jgi:hypothetical protein